MTIQKVSIQVKNGQVGPTTNRTRRNSLILWDWPYLRAVYQGVEPIVPSLRIWISIHIGQAGIPHDINFIVAHFQPVWHTPTIPTGFHHFIPQQIAYSVIFHDKCTIVSIVVNSWIIEKKKRVTVNRQVSTHRPQHINIPLVVKIDVFHSVNLVVIGAGTVPAVCPLPLALGGGGEEGEKGGKQSHKKY